MNKGELISDGLNALSFAFLSQITTEDILKWCYEILFILSIALSIFFTIYGAIKDKKITKEEADEIKNTIDESAEKVKKEMEIIQKKDKIIIKNPTEEMTKELTEEKKEDESK